MKFVKLSATITKGTLSIFSIFCLTQNFSFFILIIRAVKFSRIIPHSVVIINTTIIFFFQRDTKHIGSLDMPSLSNGHHFIGQYLIVVFGMLVDATIS